MILASHGPRSRIICLMGIAALIVCGEVRVQAEDAADKRSFVQALKRREKLAREARETVERAPRVAVGSAAKHVRPLSTVPALAATPSAGLPSASPLAPTGFGVGRDGFAETFFFETFGTQITATELDSISAALSRGVKPEKLAETIWRSPEHRALQQDGLAPSYTFKQAYNNAIAAGTFARRFGFLGLQAAQ